MVSLGGLKNLVTRKKPEVVEAKAGDAGQNPQALSDFMKAITEHKDPRELAFGKIADYLFNYDKLMMISRLNPDLSMSIIKNKVVIYFFHDYYTNIDVKIKLVPYDKPPYYRQVVSYKLYIKRLHAKLLENYPKLLNDVMAITISLEGKGRREALDILRSADTQLKENSMMGRFFNK